MCRDGGTGRRNGPKNRYPTGCEDSTSSLGTKIILKLIITMVGGDDLNL